MRAQKLSVLVLVVAVVALSLSACGGGGGSAAVDTTNITGSVFAAPVAGAKVTFKYTDGTIVAGPVTADANGYYSINIPTAALARDMVVEANDGTFTDEATATPGVKAGAMGAFVPAGGLAKGGKVHLDPASTIIKLLVSKYVMTPVQAVAAFTSAFGYAPDTSVAPQITDTTCTDSTRCLAGLRAAAFSQMIKDMSLTPEKQFDLLAAIAQDIADDGILNGSAGTVNGSPLPSDMQTKFDNALANFMADTDKNKSNVTPAVVGDLPFGKIALTSSYKIEYVPGMMPAAVGKTSFKIKVTKRSDGTAATGLTLALMPKMHMATMSHSAPVDTITEDGAHPGSYLCTVYYLMASGPSMGFWSLKVTVGAESATFYPPVGMAMGTTTVSAKLKGQSDTIAGSMGGAASKRSYYLFNDGGTTTDAFKVFIAALDDPMLMKYPAVSGGTTLHDASNAAWTVNPIVVSVSTDGTTWVSATDGGGGHWTVSGLTGLTSGQSGSIYVKLTVNGEQKSTDGNAPDGAHGYAAFTVTP